MTARTLTRTRLAAGERAQAVERAAALYRAGHTIRCVAELTGRPWGTTRTFLADGGVTFRPRDLGSRCTADHEPVKATGQ